MTKTRLKAFSDGVIAIIITIMVMSRETPHEATFAALWHLFPTFLSYVLSFVYLAIYWNNHHHLLHAAKRVDAKVLWANTHLLFWLSLFPFSTAWVGETRGAPLPTALYGAIFFMAAIAYTILQNCIIALDGQALGASIGNDRKGKLSLFCYLLSIGLAFVKPFLSHVLFVLVAAMWVIPDKRIEKILEQ